MKRLVLALPGDPETLTGGYLYDKRLVAGLRARGWQVELLRLPEVLGRPQAVPEAEARLAGVAAGVPVLVDGLALGVLPQAAAGLAARGPLVALVHHPLAEETGLDPARAAELRRSERAALAPASAVVAVSPATARRLAAEYGVPTARLHVACPGVDAAPLAAGTGQPVSLLSVGALTPRKGHAVLLQALDHLSADDWRLTLVGTTSRDPAEVARLRALAAASPHAARIRFAGEVPAEELARQYRTADLFVLPSFHEGYGMVFTEALAHGVPVVATTAGAIPETVPAAAGRLVPPGDPAALAAVLGELIEDPAALAGLRAGAQAVRAALPGWDDTAAAVEAVLEQVA